jgi:hypothetical protein
MGEERNVSGKGGWERRVGKRGGKEGRKEREGVPVMKTLLTNNLMAPLWTFLEGSNMLAGATLGMYKMDLNSASPSAEKWMCFRGSSF